VKSKLNGRKQMEQLPAYDVLGLSSKLSEIRRDLVEEPSNYFTFKPEGAGNTALYLTSKSSVVPLMNVAATFENNGIPYVCVDLRPYINVNGEVKNLSDAKILYTNAALEDIWSNEGYDTIESLSEYPTRVFIGIMSKILNSVYKVENKDLILLKIMLGAFSISRSHGDIGVDKLTAMIARYAGIPYEHVHETLSKAIAIEGTDLTTLKDITKVIAMQSESPRLNKITASVVMEQFYKIFYCTGHREKLTLAITHHPVWMALVYAAAEDKRFKRSLLSSFISTAPRSEKDIKDDFVKRCSILVEPYTLESF